MTVSWEVERIAGHIAAERSKQDAKWGEQNHPDGTGRPGSRELADHHRALQVITAALETLDADTVNRVMWWLTDRYGVGDREAATDAATVDGGM